MYAYIDKINAISTTIYSSLSCRLSAAALPKSQVTSSSRQQDTMITLSSLRKTLYTTHGIYLCHNLSSHTSFSSACFHCCKTITINSFSCDTITSFRAVLTRRSRKSSLGSRSRATLVACDASLVRFCDEENTIEMER